MTAAGGKTGYLPTLDGWRAIAILGVIIGHGMHDLLAPGAPWADPFWYRVTQYGGKGVDLFFGISGFLICSRLLDEEERFGRISRTGFYIRRFARILPLYLVVVAGCYAVHQLYVRTPGPPLYQYLTFTQNFWMAATGKFGVALLGITWSLAVEEQFYAMLPPLVRFNPSKRLLAIVIGCILLAPVLRYLFVANAGQHGMFAAHVLLFTHLDALMLGVLLAWLRARDIAIPLRPVRVVWVLSAAWIAYSLFLTPQPGAVPRPSMITLFYVLVTLFCTSTLVIALHGGFPFLRWKALTYTGLISYGLYLMHQPLNWAMHVVFRWKDWKDLRLAMVSFVVVYIIAALSWEWFEKRFVRFGHRFRYQDDKEG